MYKRLLIVMFVILLGCFGLTGCKKKGQPEEQVKSAEEYKAEAKEEITEENMDDELSAIEKELEQDIAAEP